jgi:hypothetical protein
MNILILIRFDSHDLITEKWQRKSRAFFDDPALKGIVKGSFFKTETTIYCGRLSWAKIRCFLPLYVTK